MLLAYLPSPSRGVWHLGPVPIRAYALCIIAGIFVAVWLTGRRWAARGGAGSDIADIALWAVPFGMLGGRLYHVITDPELYFAAGKQPIRALYIWDGGLGIPGAVALGAFGAWIGCRRRGIKLSDFADAAAPGLVLAQAIGRWGNYFNQELYGRPTHLPWALRIDPAHRPDDTPDIALYHPTFLYESLWDLGVLALLPGARPALPPAPRPAVRLLRPRLHRRPGLDRGAARRPRQPLPRPAPERLGLRGPVHRRPGVPAGLTGEARQPGRARTHGRRRRRATHDPSRPAIRKQHMTASTATTPATTGEARPRLRLRPLLPERLRPRNRPRLWLELAFTVGLYLAYSRTRRYVPAAPGRGTAPGQGNPARRATAAHRLRTHRQPRSQPGRLADRGDELLLRHPALLRDARASWSGCTSRVPRTTAARGPPCTPPPCSR